MSSFPLILLISAFLNVRKDCASAAQYLIEFLHYFGEVFDPSSLIVFKNAIVYSPAQQMITSDSLTGDSILHISDPFRPELNIAVNITRFKEIQECFKSTHCKFVMLEKEYEDNKEKSILETAFQEIS